MENIFKACEEFRKASAACDEAAKTKESARKALLELTGEQPFDGHGVKIVVVPGKPSINWTLAAPALGITSDMTAPFTTIKANIVRVSAVREIAL